MATLGYVRFSTRPWVILAFLVLLAFCTVLQTTYILRISALSLRAPQVTYFYVRSYRGTRDALNCSHLRRFSVRYRGGVKAHHVAFQRKVAAYKGASSPLNGIRLARLRKVKSHRRSFRIRCKSAALLRVSDELCISLCTLLSGYSRRLELLASPPFYGS